MYEKFAVYESLARFMCSVESLDALVVQLAWIVFWCTRMSTTLFGQRAAS